MSQNRTVNWNEIFDAVGRSEVKEFANGRMSGREFYSNALWSFVTNASGNVRFLLREHGVAKARQLARKALSRR